MQKSRSCEKQRKHDQDPDKRKTLPSLSHDTVSQRLVFRDDRRNIFRGAVSVQEPFDPCEHIGTGNFADMSAEDFSVFGTVHV